MADIPSVSDVLREVNRMRAEYGMKPLKRLPKGRPWEPSCCPLARALRSRGVVPQLGGGYYCPPGGDGPVQALPAQLNAFGLAFDRGEYPRLVA